MNPIFDIQLFWLLLPYGLLLVILLLFALINIYHIVRWGGWTFVGFVATFVFLAGMVLILFLTYDNLKMVDWGEVIYSFRGFEQNINMGL